MFCFHQNNQATVEHFGHSPRIITTTLLNGQPIQPLPGHFVALMRSRKKIQIPRNEASIAFAQQIIAWQQTCVTGDGTKSKTADLRFREAFHEILLRKAEANIAQEAASVHNQECEMQYEASKQCRRSTLHSRIYNINVASEQKQHRFNQILIDDRLHARSSQPCPIELPDIMPQDTADISPT
jgi:hypothetical protein